MKVSTPEFTVVEYCQQMDRGDIIVNHDYQRSAKVWPISAQSYLIETMLLGFPIPKLTLYQKTDLSSRRTIKEIVDGQQRSMAIRAFYGDNLRLSPRSTFGPRRITNLEAEDQQRFLEYSLSVDLLVNATDADIRQLFRRINSYTVPLNPQEERHAVFQGEFKWFIVDLTDQYAQTLKDTGVFSEAQLSRMADAALFSEIVLALRQGIQTAAPGRLYELYQALDTAFPDAETTKARIDEAWNWVLRWEALHRGVLMKPFNFYSLFLAIIHSLSPMPRLQALAGIATPRSLGDPGVLEKLSELADAVDDPERHPGLREFVEAGSQATNTLKMRRTRFVWFCKAMGPGTLQ